MFYITDELQNCLYLIQLVLLRGVLVCDSIYAERAVCYHLCVCQSICLSHWWISQKQLKLGSCNFHH